MIMEQVPGRGVGAQVFLPLAVRGDFQCVPDRGWDWCRLR
jgi:hypothetical protein